MSRHLRGTRLAWLKKYARPVLGGLLIPCCWVDAQVRLSVEILPGERLRIAWPESGNSFQLEATAALGQPWEPSGFVPQIMGDQRMIELLAADAVHFFRLRQAGGGTLKVESTSPVQGEGGVAVTRETIFRLSAPLAPSTVLDSSRLYALAGGRKLLSRAELSTDRRTATLFYLENLPADSRVEATFDGTGLFDELNLPVDLDGNGVVGGSARVLFETLSTMALPTTGIQGHVFAAEKNADGSNRPLQGVIVTVDGQEETLRATTDADGFFYLAPCPSGRFFVSVDGRTAPESDWPGGAYYPFVGKAWDAAPGRTNNLAGGSGIIYLPLIQDGALKNVSATTETKITFAPSVLASNPALAGVEISVPANGLFSDNGTRGGQVGMAPVPFDRLPEPLPPGLNLPLVITIQTDGPRNFDQPVPVKFPNLPDPVTGVLLPPGAKTALWSFNHDTGHWELQGPATVTADGKFVVSDPGVGVRQPGWHGVAPGGGGGGPGRCPPFCNPNPPDEKDPCDEKAAGIFLSIHDLVVDSFAAAGGNSSWLKGCLLGAGVSASRAVRDCLALNDAGCSGSIKANYVGTGLGCVPYIGTILGLGWGGKGLIDASFEWYDCEQNKQGPDRQSARISALGVPIPNSMPPALHRAIGFLNQQLDLARAASNLVSVLYGSPELFAPASPADSPAYKIFFTQLNVAVGSPSPGGTTVTAEERAALLALPRPGGVSTAGLTAAINRVEQVANDALNTNENLRTQVIAAYDRFLSVAEPLLAAGWDGNFYGLERAIEELGTLAGSGQVNRPDSGSVAANSLRAASVPNSGQTVFNQFPRTDHFFRLLNLENGFEQRGRLSAQGRFNNLILAPNTAYQISYADPYTLHRGAAWFKSLASGLLTEVPAAPMLDDPSPDSDRDGLTDIFETILGTSTIQADTDDDGISDGAEIAAGTNPSDGEPAALGILASRETPGQAVDLDTLNDFAVVADSDSGLAVFNVANPLAPVLLHQTLAGTGTFFAVATAGDFVAAVPGLTFSAQRRMQVFRLSSDGSLLPSGAVPLPGAAETIVAAGRYAYAPARSGNGASLAVVRLRDSLLMRHVPIAGEGLTALAIDGDILWGLSSTELVSFRIVGDNLERLGSLGNTRLAHSPLEPGPELTAGNGRAYAGYFEGFRIIDITDPALPSLIYAPPTIQTALHDLAATGSGLILAVTSFAGTPSLAFSTYDVRTDRSTNFVASFDTPGGTRAAVLHRGYALVADDAAGLAVMNFLAPDRGTNPPTIRLRPFVSHPPTGQEADEAFYVSTETSDDVQVRDVEFYIDGSSAGRSGKFPFAATLIAPAQVAGKTNFILRAKATDTGGNSAFSEELTLNLLPDLTPPRLVLFTPAHNSTQARGSLSAVTAAFDSVMDLPRLQSGWTLTAAGPDGNFGTADDVAMPGQAAYDSSSPRTVTLSFGAPLVSGKYRSRVGSSVADLGGNLLGTNVVSDFSVPSPLPIQATPANGSVWLPGSLSRVEIRFDERLRASSVTTNSLRVTTTNVSPTILQAASASISSDGFGAVLQLAQPVPLGTYRVVFTPAILDVYGSPVTASNFPIVFTVKAPAEWISNINGQWSAASNWLSGTLPIANDNVIIDRPNASPVVTLRTGASVTTLRSEESFVMDGSRLTVVDRAIFNGPLLMTNQSSFSGGRIELRQNTVIDDSLNKFVIGSVLLNSGLFEWREGGFVLQNAVFHNLPGGVFAIRKKDFTSFVGSSRFENEGTILKDGGTGGGTFDGFALINKGLIDVRQGVLQLFTATTNLGEINVAAGTGITFGDNFAGGTFVQLGGRFTGDGNVLFNRTTDIRGGVFDLGGTSTVANVAVTFDVPLRTRALFVQRGSLFLTPLILNADSVIGAGGLDLRRTISGRAQVLAEGLAVMDGRLAEDIVLRAEGGLVIDSLVLADRARVENAGPGRMDTGSIFSVENFGRFDNLPGATFDLVDGVRLEAQSFNNQRGFIRNAGLIRKSTGTNVAFINGEFQNDGQLVVSNGTVRMVVVGTHAGVFNIAAGATLNFEGGSNVFASASQFMGPGDILFGTRTPDFNRPFGGTFNGQIGVGRLILSNVFGRFPTGTYSNLILAGAAMELGGDLTIGPGFIMRPGSEIRPAPQLASVSVFNPSTLSVTAGRLADRVRFFNSGRVEIGNPGDFGLPLGAFFHNQTGGTVVSTANVTSTGSGTGTGVMINDGTFTLTTAYNITRWAITNTGLWEIKAGTNQIARLALLSGEVRLVGGTIEQYRFFPADQPPLLLAGGSLTGTGTVTTAAGLGQSVTTNIGSIIRPGLPFGVMTIGPRFVQSPGGTLEIEIGGTQAGTQHDQLNVPDIARLGGTLRLLLRDGFVPEIGNEFVIMNFNSRSTTQFATIEGQDIGGGKRLDVVYEARRVLVRCIARP